MPYTTKPRKRKGAARSMPPPDMQALAVRYLEARRILADSERTRDHGAGRHAIKFIQSIWEQSSDYFRWLSVRHYAGGGTLSTYDWVEIGLLKFMGYEVGAHGESVQVRHGILDDVFLGPLPPINSSEYMREWGKPESSSRLKKLAQTINQFAELHYKEIAKRQAVADWLADLEHLHVRYYVPMMSRLNIYWGWPQIR